MSGTCGNRTWVADVFVQQGRILARPIFYLRFGLDNGQMGRLGFESRFLRVTVLRRLKKSSYVQLLCSRSKHSVVFKTQTVV